MNDRDRLEQLHVLLARLERLPASAQRDWMLKEVRVRAVDVETGVRPAPLRPLQTADESAPPAPGPTPPGPAPSVPRRRPRAARVARREPPRAALPPAFRMAPEQRPDPLEGGLRLSLEDAAPDVAGSPAPWVRGLRG